ncbi:hypothetical protein B0H13DRAFT_1997523 [Mycena leptocephala]|nr:hypothetical protein B0H13DRAFT_1997523 [Mycena leptocephala]
MASTISVVDLPPEITSVIFVHCIQVYEDEWYYEERLPGLSPRAAPLLLGRICRQWRSIAWSTPALWNAIQVHCPYYIEDVVPALQRWLLRAGSLPLTIDLRYIAHPGTSSDGILDLLQRHSEQLQDLTLNIDPEDYFRLAEILGPLPLLQKIFFTCRRLRDYDGMQITAFRIAPRLIDVHFLANFSPINIDLPWEQLTTFRADSLTVVKCLLVLSLAPNLVTGRFEYRATGGPLVDVPPLLHLKSLILQGMEASTKLLAHLTTPALVSRCALDHLTFAATGWTSTMYRYGLDVRRVGPSFYEIVHLLNAHPQFLPNLKIFVEDLCGIDADWPAHKNGWDLAQLVVNMLETRRRTTESTRLEKFALYTTKGFAGSAQLSERLQALVEDGMEIDIEGSESWGG